MNIEELAKEKMTISNKLINIVEDIERENDVTIYIGLELNNKHGALLTVHTSVYRDTFVIVFDNVTIRFSATLKPYVGEIINRLIDYNLV